MKINPLILIIAAFLTCNFNAKAQDSLKIPKLRKHEVGVDLTLFLKYYLSLNNESNVQNTTSSYVNYRYTITPNNNIRSGLSGSYQNVEINPAVENEPGKYKIENHFISFRLGYEHYDDLNARFQVFYGGDLIAAGSHLKNDAPYWNGGYANGFESNSEIYGASAMLGFRFKINKRMSLLTESSYQVTQNLSWQRRYYIPRDNTYPPIPDSPRIKSKTINTQFNYPIYLVLAVKL